MMAFQAFSSPFGVVVGYIVTYIIKNNADVIYRYFSFLFIIFLVEIIFCYAGNLPRNYKYYNNICTCSLFFK